jgi:hypothetical protein
VFSAAVLHALRGTLFEYIGVTDEQDDAVLDCWAELGVSPYVQINTDNSQVY